MIFGELPIATTELAEFVIGQVREKCATDKSNTVWTQVIKKGLAQLGRNKGFSPSYSDSAKSQAEFMHDLLWRRQPSRDIVLAVECEWGYCDDILEDFEKLMHIKSPLKLMLCALYKDGRANNNIGRLLERLKNEYLIPFGQHIQGETFLLVNFIGPAYATANAACYQFVADQDGTNPTASLTQLVLAKGGWPAQEARYNHTLEGAPS